MTNHQREAKTKAKKLNIKVGYNKDLTPFDNLITNLEDNGYNINIEEIDHNDIKEFDPYIFVKVTGKNLYGGFCTSNGNSPLGCYPALQNRIAIDHKDCFDKWSKCPVRVPIPKNKRKMKILLSKLEWLGTKEGYEKSNEYEFDYWLIEE